MTPQYTNLMKYKFLYMNYIIKKYNKNLILLYIREMTNLSTKDIRNAMKRYKSIYYVLKDDMLTPIDLLKQQEEFPGYGAISPDADSKIKKTPLAY